MARSDKKTVHNSSGMHRQIERLLDAALHDLDAASYAADPTWRPPADVYETEDEFFVKIEIPGLDLEDLDVTFEDGRLAVEGSRREEACEGRRVSFRQMEIPYGRFRRAFMLSRDIDADGVTAHYADGFLTLRLPRSSSPGRRQVHIDVE
jgi:HSP20 family protein